MRVPGLDNATGNAEGGRPCPTTEDGRFASQPENQPAALRQRCPQNRPSQEEACPPTSRAVRKPASDAAPQRMPVVPSDEQQGSRAFHWQL